jgi:hypothetical protein
MSVLVEGFGASPEAERVIHLLRGPFPPEGEVPTAAESELVAGLTRLAGGAPGEAVPHHAHTGPRRPQPEVR